MSKSPWVEKTKKFGWWRVWLIVVAYLVLPLIAVILWYTPEVQPYIIWILATATVANYFVNQRLLEESNEYHFKEINRHEKKDRA